MKHMTYTEGLSLEVKDNSCHGYPSLVLKDDRGRCCGEARSEYTTICKLSPELALVLKDLLAHRD